jgi:hypothetical protein
MSHKTRSAAILNDRTDNAGRWRRRSSLPDDVTTSPGELGEVPIVNIDTEGLDVHPLGVGIGRKAR